MHRHLFGAVCALAVTFTWWHGFLNAQIAAPVSEARYIPEKSIFGLVVRPSAILQNPELNKLYKLAQSMPGGMPERELGVEFASLDLAVVAMTMPESQQQPGGSGVPTILLRAKDAATMQIISAKAVRPDMQKKTLPGTTTEAMVAAKPRIQLGGGVATKSEFTKGEFERLEAQAAEAAKDPDAWKISDVFIFPDDRTLVYSQHGAVLVGALNQLKPGAAAPAWAKPYEPATKFPLAAFVDVKQAREIIKAATGGRPPEGPNGMIYGMLSPLWEKADMAVVALDTGDGLKLTVVAHSPDADSAKALKGSLDGLLAMGKGFLPGVKGQTAQLDMLKPGLGTQLYGDLEKAVNELSITQTGAMTVIKFAIPQQTLATITTTLVPMIEKSQEAARQNQGMVNLKMMALAMHNHIDTYKTFPAAARMKKEGMPPHSWRVAILPFIEEDALYKQYKFDEPWDSEANKKVLAQMPQTYRAPNADPTSTNTSYVVPIIDKGIFVAETLLKGPGISKITDGLSNTVLIIETETSIPWTKPEDLIIDATKPLPALGFAKSSTLNVAFADGAAYRLLKNPTMELLLPFLTASAGDTGEMDKLMPPLNAPGGPLMPTKPRPPGATESIAP
jgi:hypothetical protein